MTNSMPDIVKAPPRPTAAKPPPQSGEASGADPQDGDFAGLLDDAADEVDVMDANEAPLRGGAAKGRPKTPKPDGAVKTVTTDPLPPLTPWLAAPPPPAPQTVGATVAAMTATTAPATAAPTGTATAPRPGTEALADAIAGTSPTGLPPAQIAPPGAPSHDVAAEAAPQPASGASMAVQTQIIALGKPPEMNAPPTSAPPTDDANAAPALATPGAPPASALGAAVSGAAPQTDPPSTLSPPASETAVAVEPRRPGRSGARGANATAARDGSEGAKADPAAAPGAQAAKGDSPTGTPTPLPEGMGSADAPGGLGALPTLPGQAATQYAVAAAAGRPPAAHGGPPIAQLAVPLVRVAEDGGGGFHIDLAPAELGRVRVVAEVSDGQVTLSVQAEHADTLALLRRDMPHLEKALGESGLKLDSSTLQFSLHGDGQSRGFSAPDQGGGGAQGSWRGPAIAAASDAPPERATRPLDGLVDVII